VEDRAAGYEARAQKPDEMVSVGVDRRGEIYGCQ